MRFILFLTILVLFFSCASVDVRKKVLAESGAGKQAGQVSVVGVPIDAPVKIIEKPIYVPPSQAGASARGTAAAQNAAREGTLIPEDYSHAAIIYDYHRDWVYEVYCQPLRAVDIRLKAGEQIVETPFISDSERWMIGAGISYEDGVQLQHVYIKPKQSDISATLIINTNDREYHLLLKSFSNVHMPIVRWRYTNTAMPQNYISNISPSAQKDADIPLADPRFLAFNYKITYSRFKKPAWLPELAYDDGKKTYIHFPPEVLQTELPAVFENKGDVVNYRVVKNIIIIDKLIKTISIKLGEYSVSVEKKKGKS
jgi:type IV secretion system protein VirB9